MKQLSDAQVMGQVQRALLMTASGPAPKDVLDRILAMTRENLRREKLHRQIGALEATLARTIARGKDRTGRGTYRLRSKITRLKYLLDQQELNL